MKPYQMRSKGTVWHIKKEIEKGKENEISNPERGLYILSKFLGRPTQKIATAKERIRNEMKKILESFPKGMNYSELVRNIEKALPDVPKNTIHGAVWDIKKEIEEGKESEISNPERGLYILAKFLDRSTPVYVKRKEIKEEDFYKPFAEYLVKELGECTSAIPLGGNIFGDKWGTPDVIGIYKFSELDPIRPPIEIISAEIKLDTNQLITAFGQACAYKLFSHKVYLAVPKNSLKTDIGRIESLCLRFGLGLVLFNADDAQNPSFEIRSRALRSEPDYYYVNFYLKKLSKEQLKKLGL